MGDSIFWIEVDKIDPNPYQPRREFDEARLKDLSDSIRQYGILQPLTVTRKEEVKDDGGLATRYELIAGERRLRASKLAGLLQVPVIVHQRADDARVKLELAIIENLQREDLNAVDRARAFERLIQEFGFKHAQIAEKVGKSREYVSNSVRVLLLPPEMIQAVTEGKITEGHTRPLLMLSTRPQEQVVLFKEIMYKKLSVRETESLARRVAYDKVRKKEYLLDPEIADLEIQLTESLGTRVKIEQKDKGGQLVIDYFTPEDLRSISFLIKKNNEPKKPDHLMDQYVASGEAMKALTISTPISMEQALAEHIEKKEETKRLREEARAVPEHQAPVLQPVSPLLDEVSFEVPTPTVNPTSPIVDEAPLDDRSKEEQDEDLYSVNSFTI